jgi:hypothetical protein
VATVLYGFWAANYMAFNGDVIRELAAQFLALAEQQKATGMLVSGGAGSHRAPRTHEGYAVTSGRGGGFGHV